jgi:cellulose synthase/poly-beta-1,6-N-acetylglucosamine synthase-like glycosyltransferase
MMPVRISIVVPTYQRPGLLAQCLSALIDQDFPPQEYEIVIADDAASEATRRQVELMARTSRACLRYVPVEHAHGPAAARNVGWRAARGAIIAFTDDDTIPAQNWLKVGVDVFACDVDAAWGRIVMPLHKTPTDYELNAAGLEEAEFATANCFYRRSVLEFVGGFDERFTQAWREDSDLYFTMLENGMKLVRAPEAVVIHPVRPAPWGISLRQQRKTMFDALLFQKHPQLYRRRIPAFPHNYYLMVGALGVATWGWLGGRKRIALSAGAIWALLTGKFCAKRLRDTSRAPLHVTEMIVTSALIPPVSFYWRLRGALKFRTFFV